jgi:hypothetical protein
MCIAPLSRQSVQSSHVLGFDSQDVAEMAAGLTVQNNPATDLGWRAQQLARRRDPVGQLSLKAIGLG